MTVAFVAAGSAAGGGSGPNAGTPAGLVAGDVMIGLTATRGSASFITPVGWHHIAEVTGSGPDTASSHRAIWRAYQPGDPVSWDIGPSSVNLARSIILGYSGVDTEDAVDAFATNNGVGPDVTWASVTAAQATVVIGSNSHVTAGTSVTAPSGTTQRWAPASATGGEAQGYAWDKAVSAGATGTFGTTFPGGESDGWGAITLALRPKQPKWTVGRGAFGVRSGGWR